MSLMPRQCNIFCPNRSKLDRAYQKITELELILKSSRKIILEEVAKEWQAADDRHQDLDDAFIDDFDTWLKEQIKKA